MGTVLITSVLLLAVIAFAIYRWQRPRLNDQAERALPPMPPHLRGLFDDTDSNHQLALVAARAAEQESQRTQLLARAKEGDKEALADAHAFGDDDLYEEVLDTLVERAGSDTQLFALVSYIARSEHLKVNVRLALKFIEIWRLAPDRRSTSEALHVAALANDAEVYRKTVESALQFWREGRLQNIPAEELHTLVESEYWILAPDARNSGAGFVLKRTLAAIRRELATKR